MYRDEPEAIMRHGIFRRLFDKFTLFDDEDGGDCPVIEQLEGRVLLSANPLSELYAVQPQNQSSTESAVHVALSPAKSAGVTAANVAQDVTAPTIYSPTIANNALIRGPITLSAYVGDAGSDSLEWSLLFKNTVTGIEHGYGGDPVQTPGSAWVYRSFCTVNPERMSDGEYAMTFTVTDASGNSSVYSATVKVDTTPPVIEEITIDKAVLQTFEKVRFSIKAHDMFDVTKYTLAINGKNVSVNSSGIASYTFKEAGTYELVATATDKAGNVSTTHTQTITVAECPDVKAPTIQIGSGGIYNKDVPVRVAIFDVDSLHVDWVVTLTDHAAGRSETIATGNGTMSAYVQVATIAIQDYPDGKYTILVTAIDKGGNVASRSVDFIIDTLAPTLSLESETEHFETGKIGFVVDSYDLNGKPGVAFSVNKKAVYPDKNGRYIYDFVTPGQYTLYVSSKDRAGNSAEITRIIEITKNTDITPPTVEIHFAGEYHSGRLPLVATITDDREAYVEWSLRLIDNNGRTVQTVTGTKAVLNKEIANLYHTEGAYTIELEARDAAGNVSTTRKNVIWDSKPPLRVSTHHEFPPNAWGSFGISYTYTDASPMTWRVVAKNWTTGQNIPVSSGTGGNISYSIDPRDYPSGTYRFAVYVTDAAGNVSNYGYDRFIDAHPPQFRIMGTAVKENLITFELHGSDDYRLPTYEVETMNTGQRVGASAKPSGITVFGVFAPKPGSYTFKITAIDYAGNKSGPQFVTAYFDW